MHTLLGEHAAELDRLERLDVRVHELSRDRLWHEYVLNGLVLPALDRLEDRVHGLADLDRADWVGVPDLVYGLGVLDPAYGLVVFDRVYGLEVFDRVYGLAVLDRMFDFDPRARFGDR